jgi:hypothetical protein
MTNHAQNRCRRYAEYHRDFANSHAGLAFAFTVDWNRAMAAERAHASSIPRLVMGSMPAEPVQDRSYHRIWLYRHQRPNQFDHAGIGDVAILTCTDFSKCSTV